MRVRERKTRYLVRGMIDGQKMREHMISAETRTLAHAQFLTAYGRNEVSGVVVLSPAELEAAAAYLQGGGHV